MDINNMGNVRRDKLYEFLKEAELLQYLGLFKKNLKVNSKSQLRFVDEEDLMRIGLSRPEQRRYKDVYSKHFANQYLSKLKHMFSTKKHDTKPHDSSCDDIPFEVQPYAEITVKGSTKHIICNEDIEIQQVLGNGQFGVVQQGVWSTGSQQLQVAIKCLSPERMTSNSSEFLKEAAVMHTIEHTHIVRLYGVVLNTDSLMLVTELAPLRSLLECLQKSPRAHFPVSTLCEFAEQICDGMAYLENKRLIHRDLAARNILVFSRTQVKISDFGLSRALGVGKDYYQTNYRDELKLPVAWCAPECIMYLKFTSASDVWAFGICLWEMFTYGGKPWGPLDGSQIAAAITEPMYQNCKILLTAEKESSVPVGEAAPPPPRRLGKPQCCPESYYATMLQCWSHVPCQRPKFYELRLMLRQIRPEQVQALTDFQRNGRDEQMAMLEYKAGQIITVLAKEGITNSLLWKGVLASGACGTFDPRQTRLYDTDNKGASLPSISPHPTRQSSRTIRSLLRSDVKRHTYTGKRTIQRSMISSPQGDVKHTGHVGLDGAYFGDISFLDTAGPPRPTVTSYRPSEDTEQQPLINPNSPSHLSGATGSPYPLLATTSDAENCDEVDLAYGGTRTRSQKKQSHKSVSEPTTSKKILNRVKSATLGRSHRTDESDEGNEYQEISDTETDSTAGRYMQGEQLAHLKSPSTSKNDFGQSILDEMESMFRNIETSRWNKPSGSGKQAESGTVRSHTLSKADKKKHARQTGTIKPMSAHEEKALVSAVEWTAKVSAKSMTDLGGDPSSPDSPSERSKFNIKLRNNGTPHEPHKGAGKQERRNFSDLANSVPDIHSIITEESKHAYTSLIEQPTPMASSMMMAAPGPPVTMPKPGPRPASTRFHSHQKQPFHHNRSTICELSRQVATSSINELPLPPRNTKPKLVDKPRHIRKHPLKIPDKPAPEPPFTPIIYQNALPQVSIPTLPDLHLLPSTSQSPSTSKHPADGVEVRDGIDACVDTNPFVGGSASANPFDCYDDDIVCGLDIDYADGTDDDDDDDDKEDDEGLIKDCSDHVSVEDLLEFADLKPCGRQRGVESDEVRIMSKVLKEQVTPEDCLQALELSDWNVHKAIKVIRVKVAVEADVSLQQCSEELEKAAGDIVKASAAIRVEIKIN